MPKVTFQDEDLTAEVAEGANLKEVAQSEGSEIPFGCEQGICGTCLIEIVEGEDNVSDVDDQEKETLAAMGAEPGQRLACQCTVQGDVTIKAAH